MNAKAQEALSSMSDEQIAQVYRTLFESWPGQMVLEHIKLRAYVYQPSFDETNCNTPFCIHNEGKRAVVLQIETMMRLQPQPKTVGEDINE